MLVEAARGAGGGGDGGGVGESALDELVVAADRGEQFLVLWGHDVFGGHRRWWCRKIVDEATDALVEHGGDVVGDAILVEGAADKAPRAGESSTALVCLSVRGLLRSATAARTLT